MPLSFRLYWSNSACLTPCGLQAGNTDFEVATRLHTVVSLRRVQGSAWGQSPSLLVWRHHMRHTVVQNSSGRQVIWCRRTAALEQSACFTAVIWQSLPIQKTVENVFVCQGLDCGAWWLLLLGPGYKYSYLLKIQNWAHECGSNTT